MEVVLDHILRQLQNNIVAHVTTDLSVLPAHAAIPAMDDLSICRHHELYTVANAVVFDAADIILEMLTSHGAELHALASGIPLILQSF